jgi:hypothetical protein
MCFEDMAVPSKRVRRLLRARPLRCHGYDKRFSPIACEKQYFAGIANVWYTGAIHLSSRQINPGDFS